MEIIVYATHTIAKFVFITLVLSFFGVAMHENAPVNH